MLIHMGVPILLVSERLGHKNVETTLQTYGHLYPAQTEEALRRMDAMMGSDLKDPQQAAGGMVDGPDQDSGPPGGDQDLP